jgi:hypothetical protein
MRTEKSKRRPGPIKNVVLLRGGFVDSAGSEGVFNLFTRRGYNVSVVQNPTPSLTAHLAATKQIEQQEGDVGLVGHSYGDVVITESGNHPKVKRLIYITALAADAGGSVSSLIAQSAAPDPAVRRPLSGQRRSCQGRLHGQIPGALGGEALQGTATTVAWKSKPSFYVLAIEHGMIPPPARRMTAPRCARPPVARRSTYPNPRWRTSSKPPSLHDKPPALRRRAVAATAIKIATFDRASLG